MQLGAAWRHAIPGGLPVLGSFVLGLGATVFSLAEGLDQFEAIYASVITGKYWLLSYMVEVFQATLWSSGCTDIMLPHSSIDCNQEQPLDTVMLHLKLMPERLL